MKVADRKKANRSPDGKVIDRDVRGVEESGSGERVYTDDGLLERIRVMDKIWADLCGSDESGMM